MTQKRHGSLLTSSKGFAPDSTMQPPKPFGAGMRRREFVGLAGAAVAMTPFAAHAQPSLPVVGVLSSGPPGPLWDRAVAEGLKQTGYIDGENVRVVYRYSSGAVE